MKPIIAHRTTIDAEREFDLWLTFVGQPTDPMNRHLIHAATALAPTEAEIQRTAYFIWLQNGRPAGRELEHWLAAKALLSASSPQTRTSAPAPRRRNPLSSVPATLGQAHNN